MEMKTCGEFIRERRAERGLSQQQLASALHVTREAVSKWENGRGFPDVSLLPPLAEALDVSVSELLLARRGEPDGEAIYNWIYLTERERELQLLPEQERPEPGQRRREHRLHTRRRA